VRRESERVVGGQGQGSMIWRSKTPISQGFEESKRRRGPLEWAIKEAGQHDVLLVGRAGAGRQGARGGRSGFRARDDGKRMQ